MPRQRRIERVLVPLPPLPRSERRGLLPCQLEGVLLLLPYQAGEPRPELLIPTQGRIDALDGAHYALLQNVVVTARRERGKSDVRNGLFATAQRAITKRLTGSFP